MNVGGLLLFRSCHRGSCLLCEGPHNHVLCMQGPSLGGLFGRVSGTTPGFAYSKANKEAAITWSEETLFEYLLNPKK